MYTPIRTKLCAAVHCICVATTCWALAVPLASAAEQPPPSRVVSYAGLDISKPAGAAILYRRIRRAAYEVCALRISSDKHLLGFEQKCFKQSVANAVNAVNSPALAEMYAKTIRLAAVQSPIDHRNP